jgi:hypothetical protein
VSRGQLPRDPFFFPKMKHRARKRRTDLDLNTFIRMVETFPDVHAVMEKFAKQVAAMVPAIRAIRDEYAERAA